MSSALFIFIDGFLLRAFCLFDFGFFSGFGSGSGTGSGSGDGSCSGSGIGSGSGDGSGSLSSGRVTLIVVSVDCSYHHKVGADRIRQQDNEEYQKNLN